jgi:hypothetical protein
MKTYIFTELGSGVGEFSTKKVWSVTVDYDVTADDICDLFEKETGLKMAKHAFHMSKEDSINFWNKLMSGEIAYGGIKFDSDGEPYEVIP